MRPPVLRLHHDELIVDNFAGGGGASVGIEWALGRSPDIAINHDPQAVAMHQANHPATKHYVEDVWKVDPKKACGGKPVGLAWFSPDCKHFSKAKGGRPVSMKIRGLAWIVVKWAKAVKPRVIMLENVEEFQTWGPLGDDDRPDKLRRGSTFRRWKSSLEALGYKIEFRELIAADYGAPTTRKRLFLVARCDGLPIRWPEKTHDQHGRGLPKWRAAAECIDWSLPCPSIFLTPEEAKPLRVKRPLAENTMRRIARGLQKFVIDNPNPYIVGVGGRMGQSAERPVDRPMQTITAKGDSALAVPVIAKFRGDSPGSSVEAPMPTITAGPAENPAGAAHALGLIAPVLSAFYGDKGGQPAGRCRDVRDPQPTQTADPRFAVVSAGIVPVTHQGADRNESTDEPMRTITGAHRGEKALATAMIAPVLTEHANATNPRSWRADEPLRTQCAEVKGGHFALAAATLVRAAHGERDKNGKKRGKGEHSVDAPLPTQTASPDFAVTTAVLVGAGGPEYSGKPKAVDVPMNSVLAESHVGVAAATLITTGYGERTGQAPRAQDIENPLGTIVQAGKHAAVMAFMAQHNGGFYDKRGGAGRSVDQPLSTITHAGSNQNLVASFGVKLKGTCKDGQQLDLPLATINAEGTHHALAEGFLLAYYGNEKDGQAIDDPLRTVTVKDRLGLVRVEGDWYQIVDIGMRMLVPPELYKAQGFPPTYKIEITYKGKPLPKDAQVRMCGNSVSPFPCRALVEVNFEDQVIEVAAA
jgi:DNA (cytosine-5)-methyltransferase 1